MSHISSFITFWNIWDRNCWRYCLFQIIRNCNLSKKLRENGKIKLKWLFKILIFDFVINIYEAVLYNGIPSYWITCTDIHVEQNCVTANIVPRACKHFYSMCICMCMCMSAEVKISVSLCIFVFDRNPCSKYIIKAKAYVRVYKWKKWWQKARREGRMIGKIKGRDKKLKETHQCYKKKEYNHRNVCSSFNWLRLSYSR